MAKLGDVRVAAEAGGKYAVQVYSQRWDYHDRSYYWSTQSTHTSDRLAIEAAKKKKRILENEAAHLAKGVIWPKKGKT